MCNNNLWKYLFWWQDQRRTTDSGVHRKNVSCLFNAYNLYCFFSVKQNTILLWLVVDDYGLIQYQKDFITNEKEIDERSPFSIRGVSITRIISLRNLFVRVFKKSDRNVLRILLGVSCAHTTFKLRVSFFFLKISFHNLKSCVSYVGI